MTASALLIENLSFAYAVSDGEAPFRLALPRLEISPREQVLLVAPSGSGKSTLLALVAGLLEPGAGRVLIAGQDIHALRGAARDRFRGRHVGMIFQTFNLLHGFSAEENVSAAMLFADIPQREHRTRARDLLASLGIKTPGRLVDRLSVGQQQRVAVARALACRPDLVLADEPTASLDPANAAAAIELIQKACAANGAALLCVSHDPGMESRFTRHEHLAGVRA
jgi:putative ABC transport system ATP-binding protein